MNLNAFDAHPQRNRLWVVMDKDRSTVLKDPGLNRPWSNLSRKRAEAVAKEVGGVAELLTEAIKYVMQNPRNWPGNAKN